MRHSLVPSSSWRVSVRYFGCLVWGWGVFGRLWTLVFACLVCRIRILLIFLSLTISNVIPGGFLSSTLDVNGDSLTRKTFASFYDSAHKDLLLRTKQEKVLLQLQRLYSKCPEICRFYCNAGFSEWHRQVLIIWLFLLFFADVRSWKKYWRFHSLQSWNITHWPLPSLLISLQLIWCRNSSMFVYMMVMSNLAAMDYVSYYSHQ